MALAYIVKTTSEERINSFLPEETNLLILLTIASNSRFKTESGTCSCHLRYGLLRGRPELNIDRGYYRTRELMRKVVASSQTR
jgi:hypothetical protein